MRPEFGPGLRARGKASRGKGREAGLQRYGQSKGSFAVLRAAGGAWIFDLATTGFTPDLSHQMASLSTGRNQSRRVFVSSLSLTGASQCFPSHRRPLYEASATEHDHLEPIFSRTSDNHRCAQEGILHIFFWRGGGRSGGDFYLEFNNGLDFTCSSKILLKHQTPLKHTKGKPSR